MDDFLAMLFMLVMFVALMVFSVTGVMYFVDFKADRYTLGYECATYFMQAETRADSLQLQLDGCELREVE